MMVVALYYPFLLIYTGWCVRYKCTAPCKGPTLLAPRIHQKQKDEASLLAIR